jgi:hypothetical protein
MMTTYPIFFASAPLAAIPSPDYMTTNLPPSLSLFSPTTLSVDLSSVITISITALNLLIFLLWLQITLLYLGHILIFSKHIAERANHCAAACPALPANERWVGVILR